MNLHKGNHCVSSRHHNTPPLTAAVSCPPALFLTGWTCAALYNCLVQAVLCVFCVFACLCACHDEILVYTVNAPCNPSYLSVSWLVGMFATSFLWWCCEVSSALSDPRCLWMFSEYMLLLWSIIFHDKHVSLIIFYVCLYQRSRMGS